MNEPQFDQDKIVLNQAQCLNCLTIITSRHRHEQVVCQCFKNETGNKGIYIDGGLDYLRRGGHLASIKELSEILRGAPEE